MPTTMISGDDALQSTQASRWFRSAPIGVRIVHALSAVVWCVLTVAPGRARADAFILRDGTCVVGEIYVRTSSNLFVRLPSGKSRNIPIDCLGQHIQGTSAECPVGEGTPSSTSLAASLHETKVEKQARAEEQKTESLQQSGDCSNGSLFRNSCDSVNRPKAQLTDSASQALLKLMSEFENANKVYDDCKTYDAADQSANEGFYRHRRGRQVYGVRGVKHYLVRPLHVGQKHNGVQDPDKVVLTGIKGPPRAIHRDELAKDYEPVDRAEARKWWNEKYVQTGGPPELLSPGVKDQLGGIWRAYLDLCCRYDCPPRGGLLESRLERLFTKCFERARSDMTGIRVTNENPTPLAFLSGRIVQVYESGFVSILGYPFLVAIPPCEPIASGGCTWQEGENVRVVAQLAQCDITGLTGVIGFDGDQSLILKALLISFTQRFSDQTRYVDRLHGRSEIEVPGYITYRHRRELEHYTVVECTGEWENCITAFRE